MWFHFKVYAKAMLFLWSFLAHSFVRADDGTGPDNYKPNRDACDEAVDGDLCQHEDLKGRLLPGVCEGTSQAHCERDTRTEKQRKAIYIRLLETWRMTWQKTAGRNPVALRTFFDLYIFSHKTADSPNENETHDKERWRDFQKVKSYLAKKRKWIRIKLSKIKLNLDFDKRRVESIHFKFQQLYQAPGYKELSCKRLTFKRRQRKDRWVWLIMDEESCDDKEINSHEARAIVRDWRAAWQKIAGGDREDFENYLAFYTQRYKQKHKQQLEQRYQKAKKSSSIRISFSFPTIFLQGKNRFTARFYQRYVTPKRRDYGIKTLTWIKTTEQPKPMMSHPNYSDDWKIDEEMWQARRLPSNRRGRLRQTQRKRTRQNPQRRHKEPKKKAPSKPAERKKTGAVLFPLTPEQTLSAFYTAQDNPYPPTEQFFMLPLLPPP